MIIMTVSTSFTAEIIVGVVFGGLFVLWLIQRLIGRIPEGSPKE